MLNKCQSCGKRTSREKICFDCEKEKSLNESIIGKVKEEDYQKLIVLQNEAMIGLLTHIASTSGGGLTGTAIATSYVDRYNSQVKLLIK